MSVNWPLFGVLALVAFAWLVGYGMGYAKGERVARWERRRRPVEVDRDLEAWRSIHRGRRP